MSESPPNSSSSNTPLQFDRAVQADAPAPRLSGPTIACAKCKSQIRSYYYHVNGQSYCAKCKQAAERASGAATSGGAYLRAAVLGLLAAVLGAVIYYGVIALFNLEIGLVAILIGFMVGAAVKIGARGGGGRRYQILAAALTYLSVGLAYSPVAYKGFVQARSEKIAAAQGTPATPTADTAAATQPAEDAADSASAVVAETASPVPAGGAKRLGVGTLLLALGVMLLMVLAMPVMVVIGTLPSGLLSAMIIGFGILQAWRMTQGTAISITGPYKVGAGFGTPTSTPTPAT